LAQRSNQETLAPTRRHFLRYAILLRLKAGVRRPWRTRSMQCIEPFRLWLVRGYGRERDLRVAPRPANIVLAALLTRSKAQGGA